MGMQKRSDPRVQKRVSLARAAKKFEKDAGKIFEPEEEAQFAMEKSGLGLWIGVKSVRHNELFDHLARDYFKGFEKNRYSADARSWVRFGYEYDGQVPEEATAAAVRFKKATA